MLERQAPAVSGSFPRGSSLARRVIASVALAVFASSAVAQVQFDELRKRHLPPDSDPTYAVALGDVDGDGDPDLVFGNAQQNRLYLNDGTGIFTDATAARMPSDSDRTEAVALGDVDGDGDADLVFGTAYGQNRRYLNLLRHLATPLLVIPGREYRLDAYARYGFPRLSDVAFPFVSTATARIPLPPLGTLGLDPTRMVALPAVVIPRLAGMSSVSVVVPNLPNLVGVTFYSQALLMHHPVRARLTNVIADKVVR